MNVQAAYQDALNYLYERLPMFSRIGKDALKRDLANIRSLCELLNHPQDRFKSIHIAGTNGKGSTSHMLAAVLQEAGYKTGLYTSPHLVDFRERIRINGEPVSQGWVVDFITKNKVAVEKIEPSFFEITVAMAFEAFAEADVDIAIIETGLGGRLDSTNIIHPVLSVITNISYDHKDVLGNTLREIATEKAGIIKERVPVLIGEVHSETERIFFETALHQQSTVYYAQALWDMVKIKQDAHFQYYKAVHKAHREMYDLKVDLHGDYQKHNIKTVLAATEILTASQGMNLSLAKAIAALSNVRAITGLRGRYELLGDNPVVIADVAHNPAGISHVMEQWNNVNAEQKHIVLGFVKDKDVAEALSLLPKDAVYHFCQAQIPRALPSNDLFKFAEDFGLSGYVYESVADAVKAAKEMMTDKDAMLITGSFFIVGEAIEFLEKQRLATEVISSEMQ